MHEPLRDTPSLPLRPRDGHKGTFGRVGVVGGCATDDSRMIGAPALAALGAARSGCGLVRVLAPEPILNEAVRLAPFATGTALPVNPDGSPNPSGSVERFDEITLTSNALVVGPGLGGSDGASAIALRAIIQEDAPCVLDADGINQMCTHPEFWKDLRADLVLTPHPGEARRLMESLALAGEPAGSDQARIDACVALAMRLGCVVTLKGARTVVSDGLRVWVCDAGHPCMATGGTGDVLAGVIGGLIAQARAGGSVDLFECARAGVLAHARAGEAWAEASESTGGMTPAELGELIPAEIERLRV